MRANPETKTNAVTGPGPGRKAVAPADALSIAKELQGLTLDAGTAALVAQLIDALEPNASRATVRLSTSDEFHQGFAEEALALSDELARSGDARLEVAFENHDREFEMHLMLSGDPAAVEEAQQKLSQAARGVTDLTWH